MGFIDEHKQFSAYKQNNLCLLKILFSKLKVPWLHQKMNIYQIINEVEKVRIFSVKVKIINLPERGEKIVAVRTKFHSKSVIKIIDLKMLLMRL